MKNFTPIAVLSWPVVTEPDPEVAWEDGTYQIRMTGNPIHTAGSPTPITVLEVMIDYVYEDDSVVSGLAYYTQGIDFDTADTNSYLDFTAEVKTKLTNGASPLFGFRFFETTGARLPINVTVLTIDPDGEMQGNVYGSPIAPAFQPAQQLEHYAPYEGDWPNINLVGNFV